MSDIERKSKHKNVYKEVKENLPWTDKLATWITEKVGTMGFFFVIFCWTVLWLFISNLIQILLMPLIMVGQNVQGMHSEARAEHDLEVNVKAEEEIRTILVHLEKQNQMLMAMVKKLDADNK